jgi:hypothetical protein
MFYKLGTIAVLIAAVAAPASAAVHRARVHSSQASCPQTVVFPQGRAYGTCGGRFWIHDPQTGQLRSISFGRLQHLNEGPDRP